MTLLTLLLMFSASKGSAEIPADCRSWFQSAKINPNEKSCEGACALIPYGTKTFYCNTYCALLCTTPEPCPLPDFIRQKIKDGYPSNWEFSSELMGKNSAGWPVEDRRKLEKELRRLPKQLQNGPFEGFFRLRKSVQIINPGSEYKGKIAFYDHAFDGEFPLDEVVIHEIAHTLYSKNENEFLRALGWKRPRAYQGEWYRSGEFLDRDAINSPSEDFASLMTEFLKRPENLRKRIPAVHAWFKKTFSDSFKLKDCSIDK